jgi:tripeptidyl-peptidase-1
MVDNSVAGFYSGAGFSNYFPIPRYQASVVASYIAGAGASETAYFNTAGRAFPDVSAQGANQNVIYYTSDVLGTSPPKLARLLLSRPQV